MSGVESWPPLVQQVVDGEVERLLRTRLSAGDRDDVSAIILMYAPNEFPREARPEYGICWESLVEDLPVDDADRWNWAHLEDIGSRLLSAEALAVVDPIVSVSPQAEMDLLSANASVIDQWFATLARSVRTMHRSRIIAEVFGRPFPVAISDLVADERCALATVLANGRNAADPFVRYCFGSSAIPPRPIDDASRSRVASLLGAIPPTWPDAFALADHLHHHPPAPDPR